MPAVFVVPELLDQAARQLATIGSTLDAAHLAAKTPIQELLPAAADEVSGAVAQLFSRFGQDYQAAASQAATYHQQFVQYLSAAAGSYAAADAANASRLHPVAAAVPSLDQLFTSLISDLTPLLWQTLAYLYYLFFLLLIPIYLALAFYLPVAFLGSLFPLA